MGNSSLEIMGESTLPGDVPQGSMSMHQIPGPMQEAKNSLDNKRQQDSSVKIDPMATHRKHSTTATYCTSCTVSAHHSSFTTAGTRK